MNGKIPTRRLGGRIKILEVWFDDDPGDLTGYDVVTYTQRSAPVPGPFCLFYYTLIIDLDRPPAELLAAMHNNNAQQIRRALGKDQLACTFSHPPAAGELDQFKAFFAADPEGEPADAERLDQFARAGLLALSKVQAADGKVLAWHAYVCHRGQRRARCDLSRTAPARGEAEVRNLLGRANRLLHYQDMQTLQQMGIRFYDFGGWYPGTDDPKRLNINRFKEGFGGRVVMEYEASRALTVLGSAYLHLRLLKWALFHRASLKDHLRRRVRPGGQVIREAARGEAPPFPPKKPE